MSTTAIFEKNGLSEKELKKYWEAKREDDADDSKRAKLRKLLCDRVKEGIHAGLRDHKIWWAVDLAYDAPFNQLAPTIVRDILSKHTDTAKILDALKTWNVNVDDIMYERIGPDGKLQQVLNIPAFFQIIVPLVKAYTTIRRAKLFNDRNIHPFFKYEPAKNTTLNRIIGEIVTDIISRISTQYGYPAIFKQILLQMLQYGTCLQFPAEEWHSDKQLVKRDGKVREDTIKEGLRYELPHPTNSFIDMNHRPSTLNTDTGCEWAGYWRTNRYGDVADNSKYWNTDDIAFGKTDWAGSYKTYFSEVSPCSMAWPSVADAALGAQRDSRDSAVARYSTNDRDKAIMTVELFTKLTPSEWDMGKYKYPTWFRFVMGGDDTVLWCAPTPYCPVIYWGYDPDEARKRNSSLALEVLPFQDHFSNFLSQFIYSVKQNLTRAVWYDTAQVDAKQVDQIENMGRRRYSGVPFIPFNSRQARMAGNDIDAAFKTVEFPLHDTSAIANALNTILSILERVLVLSAQEVGQAASHEQTAEETKNLSTNTLTRVNFTGSGVDEGLDAWKRQLYKASRSFLDDDVSGQASLNVPGAKEALEHLGFKVKESGEKTPKDVLRKVEVLAKMSKLELDGFISTREGVDRTNNLQLAQAMGQVLQPILANERLFLTIGEEQIVELINQFSVLLGMPKDFKLMVKEGAGEENRMEMLANEVKKMAEQIKGAAVNEALEKTGKDIAEPLVEQIVETDKKIQATQKVSLETVSQMRELVQGLGAIAERLKVVEQVTAQQLQAALPPPPGMMPPNAPLPA